MPAPSLPRYPTGERETRLDGKGGATFFCSNAGDRSGTDAHFPTAFLGLTLKKRLSYRHPAAPLPQIWVNSNHIDRVDRMPTKKESLASELKTATPKPRKTSPSASRSGGRATASGGSAVPDISGGKRTGRPAKSAAAGTAKAKREVQPVDLNGDAAASLQGREPLTHEQIAVRAYYIAERWRAEGRDATDDGVWLEAERQMREESNWNT